MDGLLHSILLGHLKRAVKPCGHLVVVMLRLQEFGPQVFDLLVGCGVLFLEIFEPALELVFPCRVGSDL